MTGWRHLPGARGVSPTTYGKDSELEGEKALANPDEVKRLMDQSPLSDAGTNPDLENPNGRLPASEEVIFGDLSMKTCQEGGSGSIKGSRTKEDRIDDGSSLPDGAAVVPPVATPFTVALLVGGHAITASSLLVANKWALHVYPYAWVLTMLQFLPSAVLIGLGHLFGLLEMEPLRLRKLIAFFPAAGMLFIVVSAGNFVVKHSNVDTFIVMRSLVPIPCAFLESLTLGEPCPRPASWLCLGCLVMGAVFYALVNHGIAAKSVSWICFFLTMMPISAILSKHAINTSGTESTWGLVMYQNTIASVLGMLCVYFVEPSSLSDVILAFKEQSWSILWPIFLCGVLGVMQSFFQMGVRKVVSSTAFMVLGVANKLMAVLMNQIYLEANGAFTSMASVVMSICGAVGFQQTVKGNGRSMAPQSKAGGGGGRGLFSLSGLGSAYACLLVALIWAGFLCRWVG